MQIQADFPRFARQWFREWWIWEYTELVSAGVMVVAVGNDMTTIGNWFVNTVVFGM